MDEFITACPRNCYSTCSFRVVVENNRVRRILPFKGNLSTPEGPCIKGLSYLERTYSPDRIIYPLIKSSDGKFHKIPTAEAHEIISVRLEDLKQKYGPQSILWYTGSGMSGLTNEITYSFWEAFGGVTRTYGNLCWPAGLEAVRLTLGSVKHNVPWDLENARTIVIWGKNPAETNIQEISFINRAKEKGANIIVIDPVRTPTADKADVLYSPKSGTDAALALAMARVIIKEKLTDLRFIKENVYGFEEFSQSLNIDPDEAAVITGIPAKNIVELAHIIAKNGPVTIIPGYGLQRHLNGGQTIRSVLALSVITGNIGKPGAGFNYANLQSYIYDTIREPLSYYPDKIRDLPFRRTISMAKLGNDMLKTSAPELKAAWIERGNPLLQSPDTNNVKKAFGKLDFIVVTEQFMTDTAAVADIILPAKSLFEYSDIIGSYWSPYVQFKPKIIQPPGEVMAENEVYHSLAKKLKLNINSELLPEPGNDNIEKWLASRIKGCSELRLEDLKQGPVLAPGLQKIAYEDMKFDTPSGKIELLSRDAENRWGISPLPCFVNPHLNLNRQKFPLVFVTPNTGSRIHSQFGNLKVIKESVPEPAAEMSPTDAAYRNISAGDRVRIFNNNGEVVSKVRISNRIPAGTVVLPNGIWYEEGGGGNHLIEGLETDIGHGAAFHDNMVEMERV